MGNVSESRTIDEWILRNGSTQTVEEILQYVNLKRKSLGESEMSSSNLRSKLQFLNVTPKRVREDWTKSEDEILIKSYFEKWDFPVVMALFDGKRSECAVRTRLSLRKAQIEMLKFKSEEDAVKSLNSNSSWNKMTDILESELVSYSEESITVKGNTGGGAKSKISDDFKKIYLVEYSKYGIEFICNKYGYKRNTATYNASKFRKDLGVVATNRSFAYRKIKSNELKFLSNTLTVVTPENSYKSINKLCIFGDSESELKSIFENFNFKSLLMFYNRDPRIKIGILKTVREISEITENGKESIFTYLDDSDRCHRMAIRLPD